VAIRAVVFDLFDTLVDLRFDKLPVTEHRGKRLPATAPLLHEHVARRVEIDFDAFIETMLEGDRAFVESHYREGREVPTELRFTDLLRRLGVEDPALVEILTIEHMGVLRSGVEVVAHHGAVLDELRTRLRLGLCSNFSHSETALAVLDEAGLREHLDPEAIVVSDTFGLRKPRAEIFHEVLGRLGVGPGEALHVGDSLRADIGGAASLGLRNVWITRRVGDPAEALEKHEGPAPDYVIGDLSELPGLCAALG
jgi:putative hydrolase of the HAD superfamily